MKKIKIFLLLCIIAGTVAAVKAQSNKPSGHVAGATATEGSVFLTLPSPEDAPPVPRPEARGEFSAPTLTAEAALIRDLYAGRTLFEKNSGWRLPIASITKLMTALVVMDYAVLEDAVEISPSDLDVPAYRLGFSPGESIRVRDLLTAMLVSSANDAALALSRYVAGSTENFVQEMNDKAQILGMTETKFNNPVGFDHPQHYSTAADLSKLVEEFIHHPELAEIVRQKSAIVNTLSGRQSRRLTTTNRLLVSRPDVIGLKTGYTAEARGSLIILVDQSTQEVGGAKYFSIILGSQDREKETLRLLDWVEKEFTWTP